MTSGYYMLSPTASNGRPLKTYGPMTLAELRDRVPGAFQIDRKTLEFAIEVTQLNPGVPYILSGTMHVPDPLGIEEQVHIAWTANLTWYKGAT